MAEASGNPTSSVRSIPTEYAGVQFRSRLEATWAYNLDAWGIRWSYEPEGVILPSGARYLPDFWLPEIRTWLEVKGPGVGGLEKTREFASIQAHRPGCREHSYYWNQGFECKTCHPEMCRYWSNHSYDCCGLGNEPYEMVVVGRPPDRGIATTEYEFDVLRECQGCKSVQFASIPYENYMKCRKCGEGWKEVGRFGLKYFSNTNYFPGVNFVKWRQMQWQPNGSGR